MNKPKLILFDIGGVLMDYKNVFQTASKELGIPFDLIDKTFDLYDREITTGQITPQDLYHKCLENNGLDADTEYDFMTSWVGDFIGIKISYDLLFDLSKLYEIGLFSNLYKEMVPELVRQNILPDISYKHRFTSCDMGMQKPDMEAYEYIQKTVDFAPEEILFIDDKEENLISARKLNWQTYMFLRENPDLSVSDLRSRLL